MHIFIMLMQKTQLLRTVNVFIFRLFQLLGSMTYSQCTLSPWFFAAPPPIGSNLSPAASFCSVLQALRLVESGVPSRLSLSCFLFLFFTLFQIISIINNHLINPKFIALAQDPQSSRSMYPYCLLQVPLNRNILKLKTSKTKHGFFPLNSSERFHPEQL